MRIVIFVTANRGGKAEGEEGRQDGKSYLLLVTGSGFTCQSITQKIEISPFQPGFVFSICMELI